MTTPATDSPELLIQYLKQSLDNGSYRRWQPAYHRAFFAKLVRKLKDMGMDDCCIEDLLVSVLK